MNEKIIDIEKKEEEIKPLQMLITLNDKGVEIKFPLLPDKLTTYGFLKIAEKALDKYYLAEEKSNLVKPHGIMDFVRKH